MKISIEKSPLMIYLSKGEENAVTTKELAQYLNWHNREVTQHISDLRCNGALICSSGKGYFLPASVEEVEKFYKQMSSRQKKIGKAKKPAEEYIKMYSDEFQLRI